MLGIDPGLRLTGYGCVEGDEFSPVLVEAGVFRLGRGVGARGGEDGPGGAAAVSSRLAELERDLAATIQRLRPDVAAVESLFAHYKHPATAIIMGHARGVILLAINRAKLPLIELKPNEIKKSITGNGHADKAQMQRAVQAHFRLAELPDPPDVADAIAIALCASRRWGRREELGEHALAKPARWRRKLAGVPLEE